MSHKVRIAFVVSVIVAIAVSLGIQGWRQSQIVVSNESPAKGRIHIYYHGSFVANLNPADLPDLEPGSFKDLEENKTQEGPWLKDIVTLYIDRAIKDSELVTVRGLRSTTGEEKEITLTWAQVADGDNNVICDVAGSGDSIKLVSTLPELDTRDEFVQGIIRIDIDKP